MTDAAAKHLIATPDGANVTTAVMANAMLDLLAPMGIIRKLHEMGFVPTPDFYAHMGIAESDLADLFAAVAAAGGVMDRIEAALGAKGVRS